MTQTVSIAMDMSSVENVAMNDTFAVLTPAPPARSISSNVLPPLKGQVLKMTLFQSSQSGNPVLWHLDMDFSREDTKEMTRMLEQGTTGTAWTPDSALPEGDRSAV